MADIFVSYSREDRARVEPLVAQLEGAGYSVWWDRQIQGGTVFSQKIEREIQTSDLVIVVWSEASLKSQWVTDEAEIGKQQNKLLPIALEGTQPPIGFRQIQSIELTGGDTKLPQDFATALTEAVAHQMKPVEQPTPAASNAPDASIAVLPFVNMSSDPEQEYFSDGISEELLNLLAKISQMHVTARTSSFQFKGKNLDITKIGKVLGVVHVLEGSVRKAGNRVRITAQLIEVATGFHKWSETYDRTLDDIFAIQDEISAAIVEALKEHILGKVEAPVVTRSVSTRAYEHYLAGKQSVSKRTQKSIDQARSSFEECLALDPDFLPAMIGLADTQLLLSDDDICYGTMPLEAALELALPLLKRAQALDPGSEEVHASLAFYFHLAEDSAASQSHAGQAITINPNCSRAYRILGLSLKKGANPRALVIKTREKVLHLDPASPTDLINLFGEFPSRSRFEEAAAVLDRIEALEPGSVFNAWGRSAIAWYRGNIKDALKVCLTSKTLLQDRQWFYGIQRILTLFDYGALSEALDPPSALTLYCLYGYQDEAARLVETMTEGGSSRDLRIPGTTLALLHVQNGRYKEADLILRSGQDPDPDGWGEHFDIDDYCLGARLCWFVRHKLGDQTGADQYGIKLREIYSILQIDHEGVHKAAHYVGACIASMDGDREAALDEIRHYVDRFPGSSWMIFFDPMLQGLADEPRFMELKQNAEEHIANQKTLAITAGLLPPPAEIFTRD